MRARVLLVAILGAVALWAYADVIPNVPICKCHFERIKGELVLVCC